MAALPRKFPSPSPEDDDELDDEDDEDAFCDELVVTGIPFVPNKVTVSLKRGLIISYLFSKLLFESRSLPGRVVVLGKVGSLYLHNLNSL